jgi:hypothetical protein
MYRPNMAQKLFASMFFAALCCLASLVAVDQRAHSAPLQSAASELSGQSHVAQPVGRAELAVDRQTAYLPAVRRGYRQWVNGDFQDGLAGWEAARGPFNGHGSGLPVDVAKRNGENRALLLGAPAAVDNAIPVGYGTVFQSLTLENRYVHLRYWVYSYDIARGTQRYYDTFEVSVNRAPDQISDSDRNRQGCASTALNPRGTLVVASEGLVFCAGRPGTSGQGTRWDTQGWRDVTLDLAAFRGKNVTLYFTVWSREYDSPFRNDRGWFNTWAYVDDVGPSNATVASSQADADEPPFGPLAATESPGKVRSGAIAAPAREP